MGKTLLLCSFIFICCTAIKAQAVYVDSNNGDDKNSGTKEFPFYSIQKAAEIVKKGDNDIYTIKINQGIYILDHHLSVSTQKEMAGNRIVIEAAVLPDDSSWIPEKMPVIICRALKGEIQDNFNFVASFLINESHVTIRGIKFHGYFYPNTRYFPIARFNKAQTDLLVEQCLFAADANVSQIQAAVIAHGDEVRINHCVFYKVRNTAVFFLDSGSGTKKGNGISNSIIYGVSQAVWTVSPDKDFTFENNIVSNCRYVWVKNDFNTGKYSMNNCIIVNNKFFKGVPGNTNLEPGEFELKENNIVKEGEITLRILAAEDKPALDSVDRPLPVDFLHPLPGSLGYEMGAGLFKHKKF